MRVTFPCALVLMAAACGEPPVSVTEAPLGTRTQNDSKREAPPEPRTVEREDGIVINIREAGSGPKLIIGDRVSAHVVGRVAMSEKPFLSTRVAGHAMTYSLDVATLDTPIEGLRLALSELRVGTLAEIKIPAELGYGDAGLESAGIPANAELVFEVRIKRKLKP